MILKKLTLSRFRNIENLDCVFSPRINVLHGQNGHGKTNILESIHFALKGVSFRATKSEMIMKDRTSCLIKAWLDTEVENQLEVVIDKTKFIKLNNKKVGQRALQEKFQVILFDPSSLDVIKRGPEQRRTFLDELIKFENPLNVSLLLNFNKVLRMRNQILKNAKEQVITKFKAKELLECIDQEFLMLSAQVIHKRISCLDKITGQVLKILKQMNEQENLKLSMDYLVEKKPLKTHDLERIFDVIKKALNFEKEVLYGFSLVGPHVDDVDFIAEGRRIKYYYSQGEQRALMLAFKLAMLYHGGVGKEPILLLDDVFSELDARRRGFLIRALKETKSQIIITTTEIDNTLGFDTLFLVEHGRINKI